MGCERLLQRLALALDEADTAERLRDEHPTELELRGLSEAEMGLIRAYLDQDLHWLRGWHAAAESWRCSSASPAGHPAAPVATAGAASARLVETAACLLRSAVRRCRWSKGHGVLPCGHCGSQLFRSGNGR